MMNAQSNKFRAHPPSSWWKFALFVFPLAWIIFTLWKYVRNLDTEYIIVSWILGAFSVLFILCLVGYILDLLKSITITKENIVIRNFWRTRTLRRDEVTQVFVYIKTTGDLIVVPKENPVFEITVKFDLANSESYFLVIRNRARFGSMWIGNMYPTYNILWGFLSQLGIRLEMDAYEYLQK